MKVLGVFCERVQDVFYFGGMVLQCQNEVEFIYVFFQASKVEIREGQVWQSLILQVRFVFCSFLYRNRSWYSFQVSFDGSIFIVI